MVANLEPVMEAIRLQVKALKDWDARNLPKGHSFYHKNLFFLNLRTLVKQFLALGN